jgi:hypothetical protein
MRQVCVLAATAFIIGVLAPLGAFAQPVGGVGVKLGTLGIGVQGAVSPVPHIAVRGGVNFFNYSHGFDRDGTTWDGTLKLQSIEADVDLFIAGGFRFTPGLLLHNNNHIDATLSVPGGSQFSLGGTTYASQAANPIGGTGLLDFKKVAPMLGIGFGSLAPRTNRHVTFAMDLGVVFEKQPNVAFALTGNGCIVNNGVTTNNCAPINNIPGVPANIESERAKVADSLSILRYYPIVSFGVGYRF